MTSQVVIYTKDYCPYCKAAKALLTGKGVSFCNVEISDDAEKHKEMIRRSSGHTTVPQIFIGDVHVGGYTELAALSKTGELNVLLRSVKAA